jgi:hypothetical protein
VAKSMALTADAKPKPVKLKATSEKQKENILRLAKTFVQTTGRICVQQAVTSKQRQLRFES